MRLTVAICTWNRAALLEQTLSALVDLRVPPGVDWELLVVNNNCTDNTGQVISRYQDRLPLRPLRESQPGLSHARNRAVAETQGDYILWTDDDVLVDAGWLEAYYAAFRRWPEAAAFGGRVEPWLAGNPPDWLKEVFPRVAYAFAAIDLGDQALPLNADRLPFGANMAIRTVEQKKLLFDPQLGVSPQRRMGGEETDLLLSILGEGKTGWWVPEARVRHYIPEHRQTVAYLRKYCFGIGQWRGRQAHPPAPQWFGRPRWAWKRAVVAELRYQMSRRVYRPSTWISDLVCASEAWGFLNGFTAQSPVSYGQSLKSVVQTENETRTHSRLAQPRSDHVIVEV
jgi:glycosyltransferase involved in cell wall biosynthesis